jgi:nucleoside-diphosphate kinase
MAIEQTLAIIKPDGVKMGVAAEIVRRYLDNNLEIVRRARLRFREQQILEFYAEHTGRFYFAGLVLAMTSGPSIVLLLQGNNAIKNVRKLNGATNPDKAEPGTIRHDFRSAGGPFNTVHGSDSAVAFKHEVNIVFGAL